MDLERLKELSTNEIAEKLVDKTAEAAASLGLDHNRPEDLSVIAMAMSGGFLVAMTKLQGMKARQVYDPALRLHQRGILELVMGSEKAQEIQESVEEFFASRREGN